MSKQMGFYVNSADCIGCKACQVACADRNDLPVGVLYRRVLAYEGGTWVKSDRLEVPSDLFGYYVSISCNHCQKPACVENCPTGAMTKDEATGIVHSDPETCIGCGTCVSVCPYDAPKIRDDLGVSGKCDMCMDDLNRGGRPACVAICPLRALEFGDLDELREKHGEGNMEVEPLPGATTEPSLVLEPHRAAKKSGSAAGFFVSLPEEL